MQKIWFGSGCLGFLSQVFHSTSKKCNLRNLPCCLFATVADITVFAIITVFATVADIVTVAVIVTVFVAVIGIVITVGKYITVDVIITVIL